MITSKNNRFREVKLGRIGLVMLIAGIGLLVFVAFLLGVNVGKDIDTYPEKITRGIPRRIAETFAGAFSQPKKEAESKPQEDGSLGLTFYDTLTKKGTDTGDLLKEENREAPAAPAVIMAPGTPVKPAVPAAPAPAIPAPSAPPVSAPVAKAAPVGKTPPAAAPPPTAPATDVKKMPAGAFAVQVVSYHERDKAGQLKKKLQGLGYAAEIVETEIPGKGKWFRVLVNGYRTRKDAEKAAADMSGKVSGLSCVIRQR